MFSLTKFPVSKYNTMIWADSGGSPRYKNEVKTFYYIIIGWLGMACRAFLSVCKLKPTISVSFYKNKEVIAHKKMMRDLDRYMKKQSNMMNDFVDHWVSVVKVRCQVAGCV